ncbi:uncharacterized protein BDW70DRAFT_163643 [Aspergillus foveolatus]|uniref:uncharacterized protein n=1 Tax=Aspergillus foveolatus TaxID=210207 RepID=UPI003CCCB998
MENYDLLIVADATASMHHYLKALNISLPQIVSISALTGCFSRLGVIAYRDYDSKGLVSFSGWLELSLAKESTKQPDVLTFTKSLKAKGGGDYPEATKTALAKAYTVMQPEAKTIILLYTDAPPHGTISVTNWFMNCEAEMQALSNPGSYDGFGPSFLDWVSAAKTLASGEKRAQVIKPCPNCGTMTEKISGCGHITCPVEGCGIDWCYFCGEAVANGTYDHMTEAHGGIYDEEIED